MPLSNDASQAELDLFHLALMKSICSSFFTGLGIQESMAMQEFLLGSDQVAASIMSDPVVRTIMNRCCSGELSYSDISKACTDIKNKSLGQLLNLERSMFSGIPSFRHELQKFGTKNLAEFMDRCCWSSFEEVYKATEKRFNFIESNAKYSSSLFDIKLSGNFVFQYVEEWGVNLSGDDNYEDVLVTFEGGSIVSLIKQAIDLELEKLSTIDLSGPANGLPEGLTHRDVTFFTKATICANGADLISIPLSFDGYDPDASPNDLDLSFRAHLSAKGSSAYTLEYEKIEILDPNSSKLIMLARQLPQGSARKLRGASLESDLGM
jgi:hypothetical protein